jgi:hypothetical protein
MNENIRHLSNGDFAVEYRLCGCCGNRCSADDYRCSGCGAIRGHVKAITVEKTVDQKLDAKLDRWFFRSHLDL